MKKKEILIVALALLIAAGLLVYQTRFAYSKPEEVLTQDEFVETFEETGALEEIDRLDRTGINSHSPEEKILEVMHQMTHQKIVADEKWGAIPMTTRNIEQIDSIVSNSKKIRSPEVRNQLVQIITKWERGDFSEADKDHNYIWKLQKGTLGKARGLLSKEEELLFIEEWFIDGKAEEEKNK
ncbi:DUF6241 domain-containing protein [Bhargavaea beijingensis]|uniref:DUF6241 domain-containing protein n=1 Tax=Bhargavaea beijingensis TaxID=426756 RepID=UPI002224DF65|nr:DUF6241 domain-containing protein [Bhargavaea beijingensis]MCW1929108.1 DUF6241 domain-containing protein [Bhargavaea beijingensis]